MQNWYAFSCSLAPKFDISRFKNRARDGVFRAPCIRRLHSNDGLWGRQGKPDKASRGVGWSWLEALCSGYFDLPAKLALDRPSMLYHGKLDKMQ